MFIFPLLTDLRGNAFYGNGLKMQCRIHEEREALAVCQKHETGYCRECCECLNIDQCCACVDPTIYCKFRTQCVIWEMSRDRRKKTSVKE